MYLDISVASTAFFLSVLTCLAVLKGLSRTVRISDQVQDSHSGLTIRLGGMGIIVPLILIYGALNVYTPYSSPKELVLVIVFSVVAGAVGFYDDVNRSVPPFIRALAITVLAICAGSYVGWLGKVNIDVLDYLVQKSTLLAAFLTVFGVVGLTNSFNLIDGLNGLCVGTAMIILFGMGVLAQTIGQAQAAEFFEIMFFCSAGFLVFNFPYGKLFLGDGGAYFLGFSIAQGCILLNSVTSPLSSWVFILMCIYPIWETIFSMFRRILSGKDWSVSDRGHLHQLVYEYLRGPHCEANEPLKNSVSAVLCLFFPFASVAVSIVFFDNQKALKFACALFISLYVLVYLYLSFKLKQDHIRAET